MLIQNQYTPQSRPHPGETLEEKLEEMGMGPKEFALRTSKPEKTIIAVLKGQSAITSDMAVQFEHVTNIPAHFWMDHQRSFDENIARKKQKELLATYAEWSGQFPLTEMIKQGWINSVSTLEEKTLELLTFFGFSTPDSWQNYYFNQQLKIAFRISLAYTREPYVLSAWLRKGEIQASELPTNPYSEKVFKELLPQIKALLDEHPSDFFEKLQFTCLKAGVKVVHTPCLSKAPINGSTRWLKNTPLLQLSGRYKRNNSFCFTFFHEAGHILLHGKKDVFLENIKYPDRESEKEREADNFAIKWTTKDSY
jgi:HTH-type transcriptional regulator / antitoxin HigA